MTSSSKRETIPLRPVMVNHDIFSRKIEDIAFNVHLRNALMNAQRKITNINSTSA